jgi:hypothetical protein
MAEPTYHDLSLPRLNWTKTDSKTSTPPALKNVEAFTNFIPDASANMDMTTTSILNRNLENTYNYMLNDQNADLSARVSDPYGYGYASSLNEARNQDAKEILMQESTMFTLGAIAGVSLIVAGLLFASSSAVAPAVPE